MDSKKINSWLTSFVIVLLFYYAGRGWVKLSVRPKNYVLLSAWSKFIFLLHILLLFIFILIPLNFFGYEIGHLMNIVFLIFEAIYISLGLFFDYLFETVDYD